MGDLAAKGVMREASLDPPCPPLGWALVGRHSASGSSRAGTSRQARATNWPALVLIALHRFIGQRSDEGVGVLMTATPGRIPISQAIPVTP